VKMLEGEVVVTHVFQESQVLDLDLKVGDVLLSVDGEEIKSRLSKLSKLFSSSSDYVRNFRLYPFLLAKEENSVVNLKVKRFLEFNNGEQGQDKPIPKYSEKEIEILRNMSPQKLHISATTPPFYIHEKKDKTGKPIGYIDLRHLSPHQVPEAMEHVKDTNSLILDLRGFTKGAGYRVARYFTKKRIVTSMSVTPFFLPSLLVEGTEPSMNLSNQYCPPSDLSTYYCGRLVALIDSSTVSNGELTCLFLQSCRPDIVLVGTPTTGALGSTTNVILPGNVEVGFVGLGYIPPDGSKFSGITPSVIVQETIKALIDEKDEIFERAIQYLASE